MLRHAGTRSESRNGRNPFAVSESGYLSIPRVISESLIVRNPYMTSELKIGVVF